MGLALIDQTGNRIVESGIARCSYCDISVVENSRYNEASAFISLEGGLFPTLFIGAERYVKRRVVAMTNTVYVV